VARQFGGWITNLGEQAGAVAFFLPLAPFLITSRWPPVLILLMIAGIGFAFMLLNFASYQLLTVAPMALVWPILASNSALVSLLAIIFLGERPGVVQGAGLVLVLLGVFATTYVKKEAYEPAIGMSLFEGQPGRGLAGRVPKTAGASTLVVAVAVAALSGLGVFLLITQIKHFGWYLPIALERGFQTSLALALFAAGIPPRRDLRSHPIRWWVLLPLVGVFDGVGLSCYGLGNQFGSTSITAMSSATFVVVPVLLGVLLIGERPSTTQALGIAAVLVGLVFMAV
jgi:drug/metabolite transporter (DMT)-like permease